MVILSEEYVTKINHWFIQEGIPPIQVQDKNTSVAFEVQSGRTIIRIGFHKTSTDSIIIASGLKFTPEEQKMLSYLKTKREVVWDLERFLIQMHLEPIFLPDKIDLKEIKIQRTIYFDALTKNKLFEVTADIYQAMRAIRETFLNIGGAD